jgi:hypothetical protein
LGARLTTSADCSGPTAESSLVALVGEHHTAREVPGVLEVPSCTAEGGSLDRSPVAAGRSPEEDLHAAEVADHTAAEEAGRTAAEVGRPGCSNHPIYHGLQEQRHPVLRKSYCGKAAKAVGKTLLDDQKLFLG